MFRVGQHIKCIESYGEFLTEGKVYQITSIGGEGRYVRITSDNGFAHQGFYNHFFVALSDDGLYNFVKEGCKDV
ncbi:MAG TPA: hypothetical protein DHN29_14165 [Cytophagales bacterium]|nr:hypothetical protein [Cytophagales bacterium]|tara:strand:+ start:277 stop:498 length:222 start_codon:yes stop_codon:yes gene_type:complete